MQARKTVQAEITELSFDPASLAREAAESPAATRTNNIRIILIGGGGDCKKYVAADGDVVYICGG